MVDFKAGLEDSARGAITSLDWAIAVFYLGRWPILHLVWVALPLSGDSLKPLKHERIPSGELAVRRGARVKATDGQVGRVDEFLAEPATRHIAHLVLREGHLWSQKDAMIPISEIDRVGEDAVYLKLDKRAIESLSAIPVRR